MFTYFRTLVTFADRTIPLRGLSSDVREEVKDKTYAVSLPSTTMFEKYASPLSKG